MIFARESFAKSPDQIKSEHPAHLKQQIGIFEDSDSRAREGGINRVVEEEQLGIGRFFRV
jgi:hypothetical protein